MSASIWSPSTTIIVPENYGAISLFRYLSAAQIEEFQSTAGTLDVSDALDEAIEDAPAIGGTLIIPPGGGVLSRGHEISKPLTIEGSGRENTNGSRLLKKSTVNAPGILITASNVSIRNLCLVGQAGNGGDGIVIRQQYSELTNVYVGGMGNDGVRLGDSLVAQNCNIGRMVGVLSFANARHGFYFDEVTTNAGGAYFANCDANLNSGDGFKLDRSQLNTFVGCISEENAGIGLNFGDGARDIWWIGGDVENNAGGNYYRHPNALRCNAIGGWGQVSGSNLSIGCRVRNSNVQAIPNATPTAITFNTEDYNTDAMHSVSVNSSRITFTSSGPYTITGTVGIEANATGFRSASLVLNGITTIGYASIPAFSGDSNVIEVSAQWNFNQGDYLELVVYQNSGGALNSNVLSRAFPVLSVVRQN